MSVWRSFRMSERKARLGTMALTFLLSVNFLYGLAGAADALPPLPGAAVPADQSNAHLPVRIGQEYSELVAEIARKAARVSALKPDLNRPPHLVLMLDTSTSGARVLAELD